MLSETFRDIIYHDINIIIHPSLMSTPTFNKLFICSWSKTWWKPGPKRDKLYFYLIYTHAPAGGTKCQSSKPFPPQHPNPLAKTFHVMGESTLTWHYLELVLDSQQIGHPGSSSCNVYKLRLSFIGLLNLTGSLFIVPYCLRIGFIHFQWFSLHFLPVESDRNVWTERPVHACFP